MERKMISARLAASIRKRAAFTLTELIVVIGIIVLLAAIALPLVFRAYGEGSRAKMAADLQSISIGLEAYRQDFGDYPRPPSGTNSGFACLGRYLIGPCGAGTTSLVLPSSPYKVGDCYYTGSGSTLVTYACITSGTTSTPPSTGWTTFDVFDGQDGPGIRKFIMGAPKGPARSYLQPEKFKTNGLAILDRSGNPILYFVSSPKRINIRESNGYVAVENRTATPQIIPMYNAADGEVFFRAVGESGTTNSVAAIQMTLGDMNANGRIDGAESEVSTAPFLLWSAGPDGIFGPVRASNQNPSPEAIQSCDDVTNFK